MARHVSLWFGLLVAVLGTTACATAAPPGGPGITASTAPDPDAQAAKLTKQLADAHLIPPGFQVRQAPHGGPPLQFQRGADPDSTTYTADADLVDAHGVGTISVTISRTATPVRLPPCPPRSADTCQDLPDGTRAQLNTKGSPPGVQAIAMGALRPDGTTINVLSKNTLTYALSDQTRPEPPLSGADLLKFATAFTF